MREQMIMDGVLPIVAVQGCPVPWNVDLTIKKMESEVRRLHALHPRTKLFLYPELYLTGFHPRAELPAGYDESRLGEPIPGPLTERLCSLARELGVWLLPGSLYERAPDGSVYNTAVVISDAGEVIAKYRKCFPWRPWERVVAGDEFVVFDIEKVGRIGVMVCYDGWFPECARQLAWLGAELILQPSATYTSDREQEVIVARASAIVNQVVIVNVNSGAPAGAGKSVIADAEGHVLQLTGAAEAYLTEAIDFRAIRRVREYGSVALSRPWEQMDAEGPKLHLPMYGGAIRPRETSGDPTETPSKGHRSGRRAAI